VTNTRVLLGRYELLRLLGEGGMGKVYLARQLDLGRQVVIKVMHEHLLTDPQFQERFRQEMQFMANFQHPYAVALYDAAVDENVGPCLIMEYVRGETLEVVRKRNGRLSPSRVGVLLGQLCEVLQAAHDLGIVHRDLKPANVLILSADTPYEKVKVTDFGLAKLIPRRKAKDTHPTGQGSEFAVGTPAYISPEQARGEAADHRSDLYSLGVIVYELLTGRLPFERPSSMELFLAHVHDPVPAMCGQGIWIPPAVEEVVRACLAKRPEDRPGSAQELCRRYQRALRDQAGDGDKARDCDVAVSHTSSTPADVGLPGSGELDPEAFLFDIEAWLPPAVAAYKLHGFIADSGGRVVENSPGKVVLRLGQKGSTYEVSPARRSWFLRRGSHEPILMEIYLARRDPDRPNLLSVRVVLHYEGNLPLANWRELCGQICCDLRAYLIGQTSSSVCS